MSAHTPLTPAQEQVVALMKTWDALDNQISRVLTAQPYQMTEAANSLSGLRANMRSAMQKWAQKESAP